jgi:TonB family protein
MLHVHGHRNAHCRGNGPVTSDKSTYRKFALFLRGKGERKAHTYDMRCYHSSLWNSPVIQRKVLAVKTTKISLLLLGFTAVLVSIAAAQLDAGQVRLVKLSNPVYPALARQANITGVVIVEVMVNPDGGTQATVVSGHPMLKQAALDSALNSRFECPACSKAAAYRVLYSFSISDPCCYAGQSAPAVVDERTSETPPDNSTTRVSVVAHKVCTCDPAPDRVRVRSTKCLYLWKCSLRIR